MLESWRNKTFTDILFGHQSTSLPPSLFTSSTRYCCFLTTNPDLTFLLILLQFNIKQHHNFVGSFTPPGKTEPLSCKAGQLNCIPLQKHLQWSGDAFLEGKIPTTLPQIPTGKLLVLQVMAVTLHSERHSILNHVPKAHRNMCPFLLALPGTS